MKKIIVYAVIISMTGFCGSVAMAQPPGSSSEAYPDDLGPIDKLGTGLVNIVTSPGEILDSVMDNRTGSGMAAGLSHGLLEGITRFVIKGVAGIVEVGTFPLPWPNGYRPILSETEGFKEKK
jgi:putative exosortase-associated protein (TIGR04073 family)